MKVILTGTESAKGIIVTRALGKEGVYVTTSSYKSFTAASSSKYSSSFFSYADPENSEMDFINSLVDFLKNNKHDVLIPLHSRETYIVSKYKHILENHVAVPVTDYANISITNDKYKTAILADSLDVKIPKTFRITNISDIKNLKINFPAVIKLIDSSSSMGLSYANNMNELLEKFESTVKNFDLKATKYPIIQEYIDGLGCGTSVLYNNGELKALVSHCRLREYPCTGGPSTLRISIKNNLMEKSSKKIMDNLNWHGVAMLEYKIDKEKGIPYLIEINPRFWGSCYQSVASGVNIPYWLSLIGKGNDLNFPKRRLLGNKTRFLLLDILSFYGYFRKRRNKFGLIRSYLSSKNTSYDIESIEDFSATFNYYLEKIRGQ